MRKLEMVEGPEAFQRFSKAMKAVISVPHAVIKQRLEEQRREAAKNPNKRGPKPKKPFASPDPAV
jgi:ribose 1,5-bisphosphokinase PhnN